MGRFLGAALLLGLLSGGAQARDFAFELMTGLNAETSVDQVKFKGGGTSPGNNEDLETNIGMMAIFDQEVSPNFKVGARGAFMQGQGEDSKGKYSAVDGGVSARLIFPQLRALPFAHAAVGPTYITVDDIKGLDKAQTGIGFHIVVGGGMEFPITPTMNVIWGAYFSRQSANLEGRENGTDVDIEGFVITRILFAGGVVF